MSTPETIFWLALAVFGTVDSALWSGLETGLYVISRLDLRARLDDPARNRAAKRLKRELDQPERALATLLVMNNISNYLGTLALAALLSTSDLPGWAITIINVAILTPVLFIFAETLPKELFRTRAEQLVYPLTPILRFFRLLLTVLGIVPAILIMMRAVQRLLGAKPIDADPRDRLAGLIEEAAGEGLLSDEQTALLDRAAAFREVTVADEMTPWTRVRRATADATAEATYKRLRDAGSTRFPVTDRRGKTVGLVSIIDLYQARQDQTTVRDLAVKPVTLAPALPVQAALRAMRSANTPIAVVERAGKPVGIVTLRDLVEPLTGEIDLIGAAPGAARNTGIPGQPR